MTHEMMNLGSLVEKSADSDLLRETMGRGRGLVG